MQKLSYYQISPPISFLSLLLVCLLASGRANAALPGLPMPTDAQIFNLKDKLYKNPMVPTEAKALWIDAAPTIEFITLTLSCTPDYDFIADQMRKYVVPDYANISAYIFKFGVMDRGLRGGLRYHPKSKCVSIYRIDDIKMLSRNALQYRVTYESDFSGETFIAKYAIVKQPDGAWLYTNVGWN